LSLCVELRERAFAGFMAAKNRRRAARVAIALAREYEHKLALPVAEGWLSRAERVLTDEEECPEHGYLELLYIGIRLGRGGVGRARSWGRP
jgi:hypothetical protein